ncbi:MAG: thioredoxin [Bacteroidales bacterium]
MKVNYNTLLVLIFSLILLNCGTKNAPRGNKTVIAVGGENTKSKNTKTIELTNQDFLEKVANYEKNPMVWNYLGDKPAIVDFYASWCGPCRTIAPILEELAAEYEGRIYIYKVDTDKELDLSAAFGIQSLPTLLFIPMGENPQISQGALSKADFKKAIETVLLKQ